MEAGVGGGRPRGLAIAAQPAGEGAPPYPPLPLQLGCTVGIWNRRTNIRMRIIIQREFSHP